MKSRPNSHVVAALFELFRTPWVVVLVAIVVRLLFPGTFIFKEDEARALMYAARVVDENVLLTHTWPSSVGIANSPVFVYIISAFARVSDSPVFVNTCLILLNLLSLPFVYFLFRRVFADRGEVWTTILFYAVSPVAVHYTRKIWDPVPMPLFAAAMVYGALRVLEEERSRWIALVIVMAAVLAQIHQSGVFFCALVAMVLIMHRPKLHWKYAAGGGVVAALIALPYMMYFVRSGFSELVRYQQKYGQQFPDIDVVTNFIINLTGHNIYASAGYDSVPLLNWPLPGFGGLLGLLMVLFVPVLYHGVRELISRSSLRISRRRPFVRIGTAAGYNLIMVCVLGLPVLYLVFRVPGVAHYFVVTFPLAFALVPLGLSRMRARGRCWRVLAVLPLLWIVQTICFHSMTAWRHGGYSYGPTYAYARSVAGEVAAAAADDGASDSAYVHIRAPRMSSALPVHWEFIFRREYGLRAVLPDGQPHYRATFHWDSSLYSRGTHTVARAAGKEKAE